MSNLNITQIRSAELSEIQQFIGDSVLLAKEWNDFQNPGMLYLQMESTEGVVAYFTAYQYKKFGKTFLITPPGFPYCGLKLLDTNLTYNAAIEALIGFINDMYPRAYIDLGFPPEVEAMELFVKARFTVKHQPTFLLDLSVDEKTLLKAMSKNRQRNIQKLEKGYHLSINENGKRVSALLDFTLAKSHQFSMKPIYQRMLESDAVHWVRAILISKEQTDLATTLMVHDSTMAYYIAGGINGTHRDSNAGTLSLWSAILHAKKSGVKMFNFCGSSIPSIEKYFSAFGGTKVSYLRVRRGGKWIDVLNKLKRKISSN